VIGVRAFAEQFMCSTVVEAANRYIQKYFMEVSKSEEFLVLIKPDVIDIVSRDELYVTSEEQVGTIVPGDELCVPSEQQVVTSEEQGLNKV
jgi:hypothetical protein